MIAKVRPERRVPSFMVGQFGMCFALWSIDWHNDLRTASVLYIDGVARCLSAVRQSAVERYFLDLDLRRQRVEWRRLLHRSLWPQVRCFLSLFPPVINIIDQVWAGIGGIAQWASREQPSFWPLEPVSHRWWINRQLACNTHNITTIIRCGAEPPARRQEGTVIPWWCTKLAALACDDRFLFWAKRSGASWCFANADLCRHTLWYLWLFISCFRVSYTVDQLVYELAWFASILCLQLAL